MMRYSLNILLLILILIVIVSIVLIWISSLVLSSTGNSKQENFEGGQEKNVLNEEGQDLKCNALREAIIKHGDKCRYLSEDNSFCFEDTCIDEPRFREIIRLNRTLSNLRDSLDADLKSQIEDMHESLRDKKDERALAISDDIDTIIDNVLRFEARGGSEVKKKGDYTYHYFRQNGVFEVVHGRNDVDIFLVGGGGCGGRGGGGGGYTHTERGRTLIPGFYKVVVGRGGIPVTREDGESSSFGTDISVKGGQGGGARNNGGSGGGGIAWNNGCVTIGTGGNGGTNGSSGKGGFRRRFWRWRCWWRYCWRIRITIRNSGGRGQFRTTREFGEGGEEQYAGGGGGMHCNPSRAGKGGSGGGGDGGGTGISGMSALNNTGGGGGGARFASPGNGGSGIVIVRYK